MRFANPNALWLLTLLPVFILLVSLQIKKRKKAFALFAEEPLWKTLSPELSFKNDLRKAFLLTLFSFFSVVALARPQWGQIEEITRLTGMDIAIVFDVSNSMLVEDVMPNRLKKAQHVTKAIIERLRGDRVGLVAFAGSSYLASPITNDYEYLLQTVETLSPELIHNQGTDIGAALETAIESLERGAEDISRSSDDSKDKVVSKAVIVISDGEDLEERAIEGAKAAQKMGAKLLVLGVGTEKGGPIPLRDQNGSLSGYKKDMSGQPVVSTFRPKALQDLAQISGGQYWGITPNESEVASILDVLGSFQRTDRMEKKTVTYHERFQIFLAIGVLFFLVELFVPSYRKVNSLLPVLFFFSAVFFPQYSLAADSSSVSTYFENEKGIKALAEGKMEEAKKHFESAQKKEPGRSELLYNQALAELQLKDVESAASGLSQAGETAAKKNEHETASRAFYNLGSTLAAQKKTDEAIDAFLKSLSEAKLSKNEQLEQDVRKRIEQLFQQKQEQDKQKKENKDQKKDEKDQKDDQKKDDKKDGQSEDKKDQKKVQDQQDKEGDGQKKDDPKKYEDRSKQKGKFKSEKLSKEDAERVMAEILNKEQQLQNKIKKRPGRGASNSKDW